ncbi:hypothetical protein CBS76997_9850 [Aspergillus niger]|nr:hypothetical protein CBS133816_6668 [Aspergillus niger]KAI2881608.1 hypothetical protein CBS13152_9017 [Aspergillus niger]KAI2965373.1 hypothetical protein CBS147323_5880 [Aspergillus niger]KAI2989738.1 hypothetical protein CBS147345_10576 [Aspergillus niger]KAI3036618.1 hypothetical protein CBS76997_9850 [Aspergillus niger]
MSQSEQPSHSSTPRSFTSQTASAEDLLKSQTVGLVHLSDFRKRRAEVLEQKEREAHDKSLGRFTSRSATPSTGEVTDGNSTPRSEGPPKKKKKKPITKSKLSFGDDDEEEENDSTADVAATPRDSSIPRSASRTPADDSSAPSSRRITPNPNAPPPPKAMTKAALKAEAEARDALRKEFLAMQEAVKNTEILIPFIFFDGTNIPAGTVRVKKGDHVWLFLDRCRKVGAELGVGGNSGASKARKDNRREWARVSVDDLMLVKGEIIVPHHYELYYFIANSTVLVNPDDAVATALNPTEDYKTSVLSGLDPNTIMECAGRALLFWTYQTTQEIFYQEFLAKTLTEKYTNLNTQLDKVVHNANSEISALQARISDMETAQDQLRKKNQELVDMYREKCKKFTQMTNLYNILKSRAMRSQMQTAATDTVSQALDSLTASRNNPTGLVPGHQESSRPPHTPMSRQLNVYPVNQEGVEQIHRHQRSGTGSSKGNKQKTDIAAMPPPSRPIDSRSKCIRSAWRNTATSNASRGSVTPFNWKNSTTA